MRKFTASERRGLIVLTSILVVLTGIAALYKYLPSNASSRKPELTFETVMEAEKAKGTHLPLDSFKRVKRTINWNGAAGSDSSSSVRRKKPAANRMENVRRDRIIEEKVN